MRGSNLKSQIFSKLGGNEVTEGDGDKLHIYGLFTLTDSDSDSDYCTVQQFPIGSDLDLDPLIEI